MSWGQVLRNCTCRSPSAASPPEDQKRDGADGRPRHGDHEKNRIVETAAERSRTAGSVRLRLLAERACGGERRQEERREHEDADDAGCSAHRGDANESPGG